MTFFFLPHAPWLEAIYGIIFILFQWLGHSNFIYYAEDMTCEAALWKRNLKSNSHTSKRIEWKKKKTKHLGISYSA